MIYDGRTTTSAGCWCCAQLILKCCIGACRCHDALAVHRDERPVGNCVSPVVLRASLRLSIPLYRQSPATPHFIFARSLSFSRLPPAAALPVDTNAENIFAAMSYVIVFVSVRCFFSLPLSLSLSLFGYGLVLFFFFPRRRKRSTSP